METTKKKKVLIYIPEFPGLTETFIEREISKLVEREVLDVVVYSLKKGSGQTSKKVSEKTIYKRLSFVSFIASLFFGISKLSKICKIFTRIKSNPNRSKIKSFYLLVKSVGYARLFSKQNPDIIFAHFMSESSTICYIASELLGCEFAISAHAKDILVTDSPKKDENAELVKVKVAKAKFVAICNKVAYDSAISLSDDKDKSKIHLLYHGIDFDALLNSPKVPFEHTIPEDTPVIFTNGRFRQKKGHKYLIDAAKIIKDRGFKFIMFILGGPGELYEDTVAYINQLELSEQVKIVGNGKGVTFDKVISYYREADVYAFPSINMEDGNSDGISNSLIEASVFKVPIVTTDAGSTLEFISHENTGLVVPQQNPYALADNIERILFDSNLAHQLAENAHNKAREMFSINKNIVLLEKLLL